MINLSKWNEYTSEQKKRKIPWIIFVVLVWCVIIGYFVCAIIANQ